MPAWQTTLGGDGDLDGKDLLEIGLNPENQLCPLFDAVSIKRWPVGKSEDMAVVDNCCQEHIM